MFQRRSSYAAVASGNANSTPTRSGAFSHLTNSSAHAAGQTRHSRSIDADGHHNSMSTSWGRSGPLPSYSSQAGYLSGLGGGGGVMPDRPAPPFFIPSYLQGSKHAEKLQESHKAKLAAQRELRSPHSSNAASLSTSSSSVNIHKMAPSHRGLTHDIIERAPAVVNEPEVAPWPVRWNEPEKYSQIEVEDDGRQVKFVGAQKTQPDEAASVLADSPMPPQCGLYYYEVTVVSKGKDGAIGVGFSGPKVPLSRIPGWESESWGYHGDDGQIFSGSSSGKAYGPKFGTLDVIGCGINFRTGTAFFTKNGHFIGTAFSDLKPNQPYYPTVGMKKQGETLRANFGQEPFAFDIDKMVSAEKSTIQSEIQSLKSKGTSRTDNTSDETLFIHTLIGQYLAHDGYVETARAFTEEIVEESRKLANDDNYDVPALEEDIHAIQRQKIRASILEGDIDKALKHTTAYYPSVLRDNENIYFKLRCRKFIEMIRKCNELNSLLRPLSTPPSKRSTASNMNNSSRLSTGTDEYDFEMELDEQLGVNNGPGRWGKDADGEEMDDEEDDDVEDKEARLQQMTQDTIQYGVELRSEFANDQRREVKKALEDTFALIAYENVGESSLAPLLEVGGRVPVAEELNSAILVSLGKSSSAGLERLVQQTEALVNELAEDGGPGSFINVRRDFLQ